MTGRALFNSRTRRSRVESRAQPVTVYPARRMTRLPALAGLFTGLMGFAALASAQAQAAAPQIALTPCRLEHPARMLALPAECGSFKVPENPDEPTGRTIELFVARVPAINLNKAKDPLFLIAGGPGTSAVDLYTSSAGPLDRVHH